MSAYDFQRIGELRLQVERLEAKLARRDVAGDAMAAWIDGLGSTAARLAGDWEQAKAWDGAPPTRALSRIQKRGGAQP